MGMVKAVMTSLMVAAALWAHAALPEGCLPKPVDHQFIYDFAGQIPDREEAALNDRLRAFTDSTSHVIVVVTHADFCGLEPARFATDLGHDWGVGRDDRDNGVVVAIRPRSGQQSGALFIAPGYGLEGAIPDIVARRIVEEMTPYLGRGDYAGALDRGTRDLMNLASGEWTQADYLSGGGVDFGASLLALVLFLLVLIGVPTFAILASVRTLQRKQNLAWWAAWALFWATSQRSTGQFRHFHSGSGGFGGGGSFGGGGGGFGGFGGGGFGGGGAGGSF